MLTGEYNFGRCRRGSICVVLQSGVGKGWHPQFPVSGFSPPPPSYTSTAVVSAPIHEKCPLGSRASSQGGVEKNKNRIRSLICGGGPWVGFLHLVCRYVGPCMECNFQKRAKRCAQSTPEHNYENCTSGGYWQKYLATRQHTFSSAGKIYLVPFERAWKKHFGQENGFLTAATRRRRRTSSSLWSDGFAHDKNRFEDTHGQAHGTLALTRRQEEGALKNLWRILPPNKVFPKRQKYFFPFYMGGSDVLKGKILKFLRQSPPFSLLLLIENSNSMQIVDVNFADQKREIERSGRTFFPLPFLRESCRKLFFASISSNHVWIFLPVH